MRKIARKVWDFLFPKNRFKLVVVWYLLFMALGILFRVFILINNWKLFEHNFKSLLKIFLVGWFYDALAVIYWLVPVVLWLVIIPNKWYGKWPIRVLNWLFWGINTFLLLFSYIAEYFYWQEYGRRFDFIAVDYLVYTHEVVGNIEESYPIFKILAGCFIITVLILWFFEKIGAFAREENVPTLKYKAFIFVLTVLYAVATFYGHDGYPLVETVSNDVYVRELSKSGIYSLFSEFRHNVIDYKRYFAFIEDDEAFKITRDFLKLKNSSYLLDCSRCSSLPQPITRVVKPTQANKPTFDNQTSKWNVILVMEESLSACFCGFLGDNRGLTPNLDRLSGESLTFTHLFATGTRTVRGMEAVMMSVPPTPGRSIVKRPDCHNMFTFGQLFKAAGYECKFIYAGHGYFDNMNYFFSHNGFGIVDQTDFKTSEITHKTIWGVCDEDLFRRVIKEADKTAAHHRPFFFFVMTVSNHRPYTYPEGRIDIKSPSKLGSVKYADWAIGYLIREAKKHSWFKNTVFIFVADHNARSAGKLELPIHRYRIPCLFYAPYLIKPTRVDKMCSQIDILPTLLDLMNWTYPSKFYGQSVFATDYKPRAFIGVYQRLGFVKEGVLTILDPNRVVKFFKIKSYDLYSSDYEKIGEWGMKNFSDTANFSRKLPDIPRLAISLYQTASFMYKHKLDRWDQVSKELCNKLISKFKTVH